VSAWDDGMNLTSERLTAVRQLRTLQGQRQLLLTQPVQLTPSNMSMLCLCAFEALRYVCCKLLFGSLKSLTCIMVFTRPSDFTKYSVSILKWWWKTFSICIVARCEATVAKVLYNSDDYC